MKLVLPRGDPDATAVDCKEAWLTLQLLRPESRAEPICDLLNRGLGCRGNCLGRLDDGLEKAALVKDNIIGDAYLWEKYARQAVYNTIQADQGPT